MRPTRDGDHDLPRLELELSLRSWLRRRRYDGSDFTVERLLAAKRERVSVVLPARDVAGTIGRILDCLTPLRAAGLIDELLVVDGGSRDATAELAAARGASVHREDDLLPEHGPALGKGDALWRGLSETTGDVVLFCDTDTEDFTPVYALGMLGPLLLDPEVQFVKGSFSRPFRVGDVSVPEEGGRVTELMARPLINLRLPELAGFSQPLAGETAARRSLLESLSFPVGYGVEIALMIDALRAVGIDAMAEVELGTRQNRHQPLRSLTAMAYSVLAAAAHRGLVHEDAGTGALARPSGREVEVERVALEERPPLRSLVRA